MSSKIANLLLSFFLLLLFNLHHARADFVDEEQFQTLEDLVQSQASAIDLLEAKVEALTSQQSENTPTPTSTTTSNPQPSCNCEDLQSQVMHNLNGLHADVAQIEATITDLRNEYSDIASLQAAVASLNQRIVSIATLESKVDGLNSHVRNLDGVVNDVNYLKVEVATLNAKTSSLGQLHEYVENLGDRVKNVSTAVAFSVSFSADDPTNGVYLHPHSILAFDKIITNVGNGYASSTGKFTAPVSGVYAFALHMMVPNAGGHLELGVMREGVVLDMAWAPSTQDLEDQGSSLVTCQLSAGEQVWVQLQDGNSARGSYWTVFTGLLVQAE